jgi:hypothetical protein
MNTKTALAASVIVTAGIAAGVVVEQSLYDLRPTTPTFGVVAGSDAQVHEYPTPSYWPASPWPHSLPTSSSTQPVPVVSISPCPSWAPTLVYHPNGNYYECKADIPPDPGGPVLASPTH